MVDKITSNNSAQPMKRWYSYNNMACSIFSFSRQQSTLFLLSTLKQTQAIHCTARSEDVRPMHKEKIATTVVWTIRPVVLAGLFSISAPFLSDALSFLSTRLLSSHV
jgi:hypothetical protein